MTIAFPRERSRLLAACLIVAAPLAAAAFPPADPAGAAGSGCGIEFKGPPGPPMEPFAMDRPPPYLRELKLSEDQQDKVFAILHAAAPALREHAKAVRRARDGLHELGRSVRFDDANANSLAQALGSAENQLTLLQTRTEHEIYLLLTAEQRAQVADRERALDSHRQDGPPPR
jgi:Spy/CpxP family protein refolding chaperone